MQMIKYDRIRAALFAGLISASLFLTGSGAAAENLTEAASEADSSQVAGAGEMAEVEAVLEEGMVPRDGEEFLDGTYLINVNCSSSMFPIEECELTVADGEMTAVLTMGGTGYLYVYPGTAQEAAEADESQYIPFAEDEEGRHTFTVPVPQLDAEVKLAAFSKRKEKWYDRSLAFVSSSLPLSAWKETGLLSAADLNLDDGEYLADVVLEGGSGRTTIESPALLTVTDDSMTLHVVFSSPNYDYMIVNGERYLPVNTEGNSAFDIPFAGFDGPVPVTADTVAMSSPHEIDYTITADSESLALNDAD